MSVSYDIKYVVAFFSFFEGETMRFEMLCTLDIKMAQTMRKPRVFICQDFISFLWFGFSRKVLRGWKTRRTQNDPVLRPHSNVKNASEPFKRKLWLSNNWRESLFRGFSSDAMAKRNLRRLIGFSSNFGFTSASGKHKSWQPTLLNNSSGGCFKFFFQFFTPSLIYLDWSQNPKRKKFESRDGWTFVSTQRQQNGLKMKIFGSFSSRNGCWKMM